LISPYSSPVKNINRLEGGINAYVEEVAKGSIDESKSLFKGKNFVFDDRNKTGANQPVTKDILTNCNLCGTQSDTLVNCNNVWCGIIHIACPECQKKMQGCCSKECMDAFTSGKMKKNARDMGVRSHFCSITKSTEGVVGVLLFAASATVFWFTQQIWLNSYN